jgi:hypothetical protein
VCDHYTLSGSGAGIGGGERGGGGTVKINYPSGTSHGKAQNMRNPGYVPGRSVGPGMHGSGGEFYGPNGERDWPEGITYEW